MPRSANYVRPIQLSLTVLRDAGIDSFPVSLKQILRHYGIRLMSYEDFCHFNEIEMQVCFNLFGKDGATIEKNGKYLIVYNKNQRVKDRVRFTLAHELGHIFHGHHEELGVHTLRRLWVEKSLYDVMEDEANCFARNLLCPAIAVQVVLRDHGFVYSEYDIDQNRNVWWKVSNAKCLPGLPKNLTDSFLVRQSFMVTDSAAKTRCHFLREDLRNTSMEGADQLLSRMRYTAQWRCRKCGAIRTAGKDYCYHCGSKNRFALIVKKSPSRLIVFLRYTGHRFSSCPVCGNFNIPYEANYCPICGNAITNPCMPGRVRNHDISHLLTLVEGGSVHLNPPGSRYCLTCGAPTVYGDASIRKHVPLYYYLLSRGKEIITDNQGGLPLVKYGPSIPVNFDNGNYKVTKCPKCLNEDIEWDAEYCIMCGTSLTNVCDGSENDYDGESVRHSNPANARFCHCCGKPTAYSRLSILPPYQEALRRIAKTEEFCRELREMDIDEDLFWEMQGEGKPTGNRENHSDAPAAPGNQAVPHSQSADQDDDGELPF